MPGIGRFGSPDPIGYSGGMNLYSYAGGDPVNRFDPMGLDEYDDEHRCAEHEHDRATTHWLRRPNSLETKGKGERGKDE